MDYTAFLGAEFDDCARDTLKCAGRLVRVIEKSDADHFTTFGGEILSALFAVNTYRDADEWGTLFYALPASMRENYCREFISMNRDEARLMYIAAYKKVEMVRDDGGDE